MSSQEDVIKVGYAKFNRLAICEKIVDDMTQKIGCNSDRFVEQFVDRINAMNDTLVRLEKESCRDTGWQE